MILLFVFLNIFLLLLPSFSPFNCFGVKKGRKMVKVSFIYLVLYEIPYLFILSVTSCVVINAHIFVRHKYVCWLNAYYRLSHWAVADINDEFYIWSVKPTNQSISCLRSLPKETYSIPLTRVISIIWFEAGYILWYPSGPKRLLYLFNNKYE